MANLSHDDIKQLARQQARDVLGRSSVFQTMSKADQMAAYKDQVLANTKLLSEQQLLGGLIGGIAGAVAGGKRDSQTADRASDLINDKRHKSDIGRGVEAFDDLVDTVDFPQFVKDLVKGVFDANLVVMKDQTDNFIRLMKEASKSIAQFVKQVADEDAFGDLADSGDKFNMSFDENGATLTDKDGQPVDMEDNEVKVAIMDAKLKLAKEHRKALQQTILMGIQRMTIENGIVRASVNFDLKSTSNNTFQDKAMNKNSSSSGTYGKASGGLIGSIFGGPSMGHSGSKQSSSLSISSAKSDNTDALAANLQGFVEIKFKSQQFDLDKFVDIYKIEADTEVATSPRANAGPPPPGEPAK
jgi:hypothetical protein